MAQPPDGAKAAAGPEHKVLEKFVGKFDFAGTVHMKDPNAPRPELINTKKDIDPEVRARYAELLDEVPQLKKAYQAAGGKLFLQRDGGTQ